MRGARQAEDLNKMHNFRPILSQSGAEKILLTLWVGALWAIGYIAVPILFGSLEDRQLAGMLAGKMFTAVSYIGLFCGSVLLVSLFKRADPIQQQPSFWLLLLMLVLVVIGEFVIQPQMAQLKLQGLAEGTAAAAQFTKLHGIASILYMLNSLTGLILVIFHKH